MVDFSQPAMIAPSPCELVPNDELYNYQYYLHNDEYQMVDIDIQKAWEIIPSLDSIIVTVVIIDEGCDYEHEDFNSANILWNWGYDFYHNDNEPHPGWLSAHGTACQGIITAQLNNLVGIAGIAEGCYLMPLKVAGDGGEWSTDYTVYERAIAYVIDYYRWGYEMFPIVVSCSWGWPPGYYNAKIADILDTAVSLKIPFVFASGNDGYGLAIGNSMDFPANLESTIGVGAVMKNGNHWYYSGSGPGIDVVAPSGERNLAGDIYTTDRRLGAGYNPNFKTCDSASQDYMCYFGGTSAACPQVAGILALVRAKIPYIISYDILKLIIDSSAVDGLGSSYEEPGYDLVYGYGLANAARALLSVSRGDPNNDGKINIKDITYLLDYIYYSGPEPVPDLLMGDANCDGAVDILDVDFLIAYLYQGGPPPSLCFEYND